MQLLALGGFLNPERLIDSFGTVGVFLIVFAESGLLIGFFLPGDSLLFTAGLLAAQHRFGLHYPVLAIGCFVAAVLGDQAGYWFGQRVGPALFDKPKSRLFNPQHVARAQEFFDQHGARTIVLARFVPIVRTFTPILAGVSKMRYRTFITYNLVGGLLWGVGVTTAGFLLGKRYPALGDNLIYVSIIVIAISLLPIAYELLKARRRRAASGSHR